MPAYIQAFSYLGPHVDKRDQMITDGDDMARNNKYQCDLVSILLNLSAIPDDCIKNLAVSE